MSCRIDHPNLRYWRQALAADATTFKLRLGKNLPHIQESIKKNGLLGDGNSTE